MSQDLTAQEAVRIREGIKTKYSQVATSGAACCFNYPTGMAGIRLQGYPLELVQDFPPKLLESFCGVGNPFSLGPINQGDSVLDIGCGAGFDAFVAARITGPQGRVVGLDVTPEMVDRARAYQALLKLPQVGFQAGEAEALPFPDHDFDVVISNGALNLTLNKEQALKEAHRVLKPGGRFMVADMVLVAALPEGQGDQVANWYQ